MRTKKDESEDILNLLNLAGRLFLLMFQILTSSQIKTARASFKDILSRLTSESGKNLIMKTFSLILFFTKKSRFG